MKIKNSLFMFVSTFFVSFPYALNAAKRTTGGGSVSQKQLTKQDQELMNQRFTLMRLKYDLETTSNNSEKDSLINKVLIVADPITKPYLEKAKADIPSAASYVTEAILKNYEALTSQ